MRQIILPPSCHLGRRLFLHNFSLLNLYIVFIWKVFGFGLSFCSIFTYMVCNSCSLFHFISFRHFHDFASHANPSAAVHNVSSIPLQLWRWNKKKKKCLLHMHIHARTPSVGGTIPQVGKAVLIHTPKDTLLLFSHVPFDLFTQASWGHGDFRAWLRQ